MKKIIIFAALCLSFQTACDKEDLGGSNIHVPEFDYNALSETDKYIYDHYTVPYNVEVVYRWNQGDVSSDDMRKNLVPPRESQVEPFLEMIEKVWMDTYTAEVGQQTLRSYIPKQLLLVGSASYNDDGSTTEGTAEGGRQIVLYSVNDFNFELEQIQSYAHVMHHEFAHILHQNVEYDAEFEKITPSYSSSWMPMNDGEEQRVHHGLCFFECGRGLCGDGVYHVDEFSGGLGQYDRECGECGGCGSLA